MRDCKKNGEWNDQARAERGCTLYGAPPVAPKPKAAALYQLRIGSPYMGRYPDPSLAGTEVLGIPQRPGSPFEPPENGCPGAWYRSPFIDSLWPFMRRRIPGGGREDNPRFKRAHWLIQDAVMHYEIEEERAIRYLEEIAETRARKPTEPTPAQPRGPGRKRRR
jgi:hypothetical protein